MSAFLLYAPYQRMGWKCPIILNHFDKGVIFDNEMKELAQKHRILLIKLKENFQSQEFVKRAIDEYGNQTISSGQLMMLKRWPISRGKGG